MIATREEKGAHEMKTLIPWALLGGLILLRATRGECDCKTLERRLVAAHREKDIWVWEARFWHQQTEKALIREKEALDRLETSR